MIILGLTGSIGMGKSTTAGLFREAGVPVHDADAAVHALYRGEAVPLIEQAFPGVTAAGEVDRVKLRAQVVDRPDAMARLEALVHPFVRAREEAFLAQARQEGARLVVLDIPLLFEKTSESRCHAVAVVTAAPEVQRARVLARPGMTEETFAALLARQMPDAEKRRRAHFLVDSGGGMERARRQVRAILRAIAAC
jgi:dephospho-CoA kinase